MRESTACRYRMLRRIDPYMPARTALYLARADTAAEDAGLPPWTTYLDDERVTIDGSDYLVSVGRDYLVSVEYDADAGAPSDYGDCYGEIREPSRDALEGNWGNPLPVEWPEVRDSGQTWSYYPGDTFEPDYAPRGMAKGPAREHVRGELIREGWRHRRHQTGDVPMFYGVTVRDAADPSLSDSLWGVDGLDDDTYGRAYLWDVVRDLAFEVAAEAHRRAVKARDDRFALTAHG